MVGLDSSVGIATRYGLDEPRCGRDFPHPYNQVLGSTHPPIKWVPSLFPRGKEAGGWR